MKKTRSPNYPQISLREAVERIKKIYPKAKRHKTEKVAVAKMLGYSGLSGKSLVILGALGAYELLEGGAKDMRITLEGETLAIDPVGSKARIDAIEKCFLSPIIFSNIISEYGRDLPSDDILRPYLLRKDYSPAATDIVIRSLRDTFAFVAEEKEAYSKAGPHFSDSSFGVTREKAPTNPLGEIKKVEHKRIDINQDTFTLEEGQAILQWPANLSPESYEDFNGWLQLILRKAKRSIVEDKGECGTDSE